MNIKSIFQKQMFWLVLIVILTSNLIYNDSVIGFNKIVNWGYDISHILAFNFLGVTSWFFFILGVYGIFKLLKIQTEFVSSIILIIHLLAFRVILPNFPQLVILTIIIGIISIVVFWINIYTSLKLFKKNRQ